MAQRRPRRHVTAVALLVLALAVPPGDIALADAQAAPSCSPPYLPLYGQTGDNFFGGPLQDVKQQYPDEPTVAPSTAGFQPSFAVATGKNRADTDGDGTADDVGSEPLGSLTITRGDGVVTITDPGRGLSPASNTYASDLDADGRDEIIFLSRGDDGDRSYVLPGTTAPGTYTSPVAAIRIPTTMPFAPVGNQTAGPGDDLLVAISPEKAGIVSGEDLLAPGAGGTLTSFDPVGGTFDGSDGFFVEALVVGSGPPTLAFYRYDGDRGTIILWHKGDTTEYRTAGPGSQPFTTTSASSDFAVSVVIDGSRTLLQASSGGHGPITSFSWGLNDPCRPLARANPPASTSSTVTSTVGPATTLPPAGRAAGTATPASPVGGRATYAG